MKKIIAREFIIFIGILLITYLIRVVWGDFTSGDLFELWCRSSQERIGDGFIILRTLLLLSWFITKPFIVYFTYAFIRILIWAIKTLKQK